MIYVSLLLTKLQPAPVSNTIQPSNTGAPSSSRPNIEDDLFKDDLSSGGQSTKGEILLLALSRFCKCKFCDSLNTSLYISSGIVPRSLLFSSVRSLLMKHDERVFELASQTSIAIDLLHVSVVDLYM